MHDLSLSIETPMGGFTLPLSRAKPLTIGRAPDNQLHLQDDMVNSYHCVVLLIEDEVHVVDLQSYAGTLINGKSIRFQQLSTEDVLRVGHAQVRIAGGASASRQTGLRESPKPSASSSKSRRNEDATVGLARDGTRMVSASELRESVTGRMDDSGAPIRVVPDADLDKPPLAPAPTTIGDLLLPREMDAQIRMFLKRESGMIIICGPEESGRSTTAYGMLRLLAASEKKIVTLEQPPEFQLEGAVQMFVHNDREYGQAVQRAMRISPDVLMLGEPPTRSAAVAALAAAVGKCLVIVVADGHDAPSTICNWIAMGVQPKNLASSLAMVLSQRLVRKLCEQCKRPIKIDSTAKQKLGGMASHIESLYTSDACSHCNNSGFVGKLGVYEILMIGDQLRATILCRPVADDIRQAADHKHYISLKLSAYARAAQGLTTMEEADQLITNLSHPRRSPTPSR